MGSIGVNGRRNTVYGQCMHNFLILCSAFNPPSVESGDEEVTKMEGQRHLLFYEPRTLNGELFRKAYLDLESQGSKQSVRR